MSTNDTILVGLRRPGPEPALPRRVAQRGAHGDRRCRSGARTGFATSTPSSTQVRTSGRWIELYDAHGSRTCSGPPRARRPRVPRLTPPVPRTLSRPPGGARRRAPIPTPCSTRSSTGPRAAGLALYPAQEEALLELVAGRQRHPRHADRVGQVAWSPSPPTSPPWPRARAASTPPRSRRWCREKFFALCHELGLRARRHAHRRRRGQPRRPGHLLHGRDPGQPGPARRRRRRRRPGRHGRVPLLRRPRPRLGLAGAAARAARPSSS